MTLHPNARRLAVAVLAVVLACAALGGRGADAVPGRSHAAVPVAAAPAVDPPPAVDRPSEAVTDSATATVSCRFQQVGDLVALAGKPGSTVSARGWWRDGTCPVSRAKVTAQLQAKHDGEWEDIGDAATDTVPPGGHVETNARCHNAKPTTWRSVIDVDLIDESDDADQLATPSEQLRCRPDFGSR